MAWGYSCMSIIGKLNIFPVLIFSKFYVYLSRFSVVHWPFCVFSAKRDLTQRFRCLKMEEQWSTACHWTHHSWDPKRRKMLLASILAVSHLPLKPTHYWLVPVTLYQATDKHIFMNALQVLTVAIVKRWFLCHLILRVGLTGGNIIAFRDLI